MRFFITQPNRIKACSLSCYVGFTLSAIDGLRVGFLGYSTFASNVGLVWLTCFVSVPKSLLYDALLKYQSLFYFDVVRNFDT